MAAISGTSSNKEFERFSRFVAVGAVGTMLDFSLLTLLKLAGLHTLAANSFSFIVGLVNNFTWNRLWTFGDSLQPLGYLIGHPGWGYLPAKVIATGVVVFWNYFANRTWTFSK
jgi:putative flippase GtrA